MDFGGVITKTLFETHAQTEADLGLAPGTLTWRGPFAPDSDELWRRMQADEISEREYWLCRTREVGQLLGEEWDSMHQLVRRARGHDPEAVIRPEAIAAILRFKQNGIKLGVLSNELEMFYGEGFIDRLKFLKKFDSIVDATHSKILKPDPRAYQQCLDELQLTAAECLFIDDQARNVDGARRIGMHTVLFDVRNPSTSYNEAMRKVGLEPQ